MIRNTQKDHLKYLQIIEDVFGLSWLQAKLKDAKRTGRKDWNYIPLLWEDVKAYVEADPDGLYRNTSYEQSEKLAKICFLGDNLQRIRNLPHFDSCIGAHLHARNMDTFSKLLYEIQIGSVIAANGYNLEFVPRANETTPDMKLSFADQDIWIECKRKDATPQQKTDEDFDLARLIDERLVAIQEKYNRQYDITIMSVGKITSDMIELIIEVSERVAEHDQMGFCIIKGSNVGVLYERVPPDSTGVDTTTFTGMVRVVSGIKYRKAGQVGLANLRCTSLLTLNSHTVQNIIGLVNNTRNAQLPAGATSLLYIDLDVSRLPPMVCRSYLQLLGQHIRLLFTPDRNTRIGAVILTTPYVIYEKPGGWIENQPFVDRIMRLDSIGILNPHSKLPKDFTIPAFGDQDEPPEPYTYPDDMLLIVTPKKKERSE